MRIASMRQMKTLQIRNMSDETHAELRLRAARAGMSLSDYALAELERRTSKPPIAEVLERARNRSGGATRQQIVDAIRAGRDDRD
jgi:plasmid stability protein